MKVNTSLLVQSKKSNIVHNGDRQPKYGQSAVSSAVDKDRVGPQVVSGLEQK
ncbi:MAG: hypothetical protein WBL67_06375 [Nitrososphaeraceae archaeon]